MAEGFGTGGAYQDEEEGFFSCLPCCAKEKSFHKECIALFNIHDFKKNDKKS